MNFNPLNGCFKVFCLSNGAPPKWESPINQKVFRSGWHHQLFLHKGNLMYIYFADNEDIC